MTIKLQRIFQPVFTLIPSSSSSSGLLLQKVVLEFRLSTPDKLGMTLGKLVRKLKPSQAWDVNKMPSLVSTAVTVHSGKKWSKKLLSLGFEPMAFI